MYLDAEKRKAEERRLAAEKRKAERAEQEKEAARKRVQAEEKRQSYLAAIKANMDKSRWLQGDRLCLEYFNPGNYITGTLEEFNADKSKCRIKIVTSPGSRMQYNGENLEKNTTMWIATSGEAKTQLRLPRKCPDCNGSGWKTETVTHHGWLGSYTERESKKCYRCDGSGWIEETQTLTF